MVADASAVGKRVRCPACRHVFVAALPRATAVGGAVYAADAAAALDALAGADARAEPDDGEATEAAQSEALDELRRALEQPVAGAPDED